MVRNLGSQSIDLLAAIGITTPSDLERVGAVNGLLNCVCGIQKSVSTCFGVFMRGSKTVIGVH